MESTTVSPKATLSNSTEFDDTTKEEILYVLEKNYDGVINPKQLYINDDCWTIAELFIRQYLNNGWDGFQMRNVCELYPYLYAHKEKLIEYNLLREEGENNAGFPLWYNYEIPSPSMM